MARLFDEIKINKMILRNRSVRSATWTGMAERDGTCSVKLTNLTEKLARGEVGLIITGFAYVMPNGQALPGQLGIHKNAMTSKLREMTEAVHKAGGKICMQIVHAGVQTLVKDRVNSPCGVRLQFTTSFSGGRPKP